MIETRPQALLKMLSEEHDVLGKQIDDLRQFWAEVSQLGQGPKYEEMGYRVRDLRNALAKHFVNEEKGGYLAPAIAVVPKFTASAKELELQHKQFLNTLDRFIERLAECESAYHCWQEVRGEFEDFLRRLHEHEAAEMSIVHSAIEAADDSSR